MRPAFLFVAALAACAAPRSDSPAPVRRSAAGRPITRADAEALLAAQTAEWNAGNLPGFVATYWDGPELTFFGRSGLTRGRGDLLATYQRAYPDAATRGELSFDLVDFRPLGTDHALVLGRYRIRRAVPALGVFTLVLARQDGRVVILHDHSSE